MGGTRKETKFNSQNLEQPILPWHEGRGDFFDRMRRERKVSGKEHLRRCLQSDRIQN